MQKTAFAAQTNYRSAGYSVILKLTALQPTSQL